MKWTPKMLSHTLSLSYTHINTHTHLASGLWCVCHVGCICQVLRPTHSKPNQILECELWPQQESKGKGDTETHGQEIRSYKRQENKERGKKERERERVNVWWKSVDVCGYVREDKGQRERERERVHLYMQQGLQRLKCLIVTSRQRKNSTVWQRRVCHGETMGLEEYDL